MPNERRLPALSASFEALPALVVLTCIPSSSLLDPPAWCDAVNATHAEAAALEVAGSQHLSSTHMLRASAEDFPLAAFRLEPHRDLPALLWLPPRSSPTALPSLLSATQADLCDDQTGLPCAAQQWLGKREGTNDADDNLRSYWTQRILDFAARVRNAHLLEVPRHLVFARSAPPAELPPMWSAQQRVVHSTAATLEADVAALHGRCALLLVHDSRLEADSPAPNAPSSSTAAATTTTTTTDRPTDRTGGRAARPDRATDTETTSEMFCAGLTMAAQPTGCALVAATPLSHAVPRVSILRAQLSGDEDDAYLNELEDALSDSALQRRRANENAAQRLQRGLNLRRDGRPSARRRRPRPASPVRWTRDSTRLEKLPGTIRDAYDDFLERPGRPLVLGSLSLLVGFYLAGALSTIFGAAGFWEPTIALGPLFVGEAISRRYYSLPMEERSQTIRLLNALKVGFMLGIVLDALKLAG